MKKTEWMARRASENITARISLLGRLVSEPVYFDALKDHMTSRLPNWNVYDVRTRAGGGSGGGSTQGFGGGAGIEWDWGDLFNSEDFPPIFSNGTIGFYTYGQDFAGLSAFWVGGGAHYRL